MANKEINEDEESQPKNRKSAQTRGDPVVNLLEA